MEIIEIKTNKKQYIDLLLLADEQESMINKYIDIGKMYALIDDGVKTVCIVTNEGNGVLEIKNLATNPNYQKHGYAKTMINYISKIHKDNFSILQVGTGNNTSNVLFYEKCGFKKSHLIKNFFINNYNHPIIEDGVQLIDMIYLQKYL